MELTIKALLNHAASLLQESGSLSPRLDAEVLLAFSLKCDRSYLLMHPEKIIDKKTYEQYLSCINDRKKGKPVQYITQQQEFMGLDFFVNENVLIPRPDTEILVENILDSIKKNAYSKTEILDIGCGSGAISISLAHYAPDTYLSCVDISSAALSICEKNAQYHHVQNRMRFYQGNLFDPIENKFDMIVSNPPYIPYEDIKTLQAEVSEYEPRIALDGGLDGMSFYRRIIKQAPQYLRVNGLLFFEIGYNQGADVCKLLQDTGMYSDIQVIKDLAGKDRVVRARQAINNR